MPKINLNLLNSLTFLNQANSNIININNYTNFINNNIKDLSYDNFIKPFFDMINVMYKSYQKDKFISKILTFNSLKIIIIMYLNTKINILKDFIKNDNQYYILVNLILMKIMNVLFQNDILKYFNDIESNQSISSKIYQFIDDNITNENFIYNIKLINKFIDDNIQSNNFKETDNFQQRIYFFIYYIILSLFDDKIYDYIDNYDYLNISYLDYFNNIIFLKEIYPFSFNVQYNNYNSNDLNDSEFLKDIRDKFNKSLEEIINNKQSLNIKKLKFMNKRLNNLKLKEINDDFIYVNKNKNKSSNIITSSKVINNIYIPNKIFFDFNIHFEHGCYFVSTIELLLTILNIDNKKEINNKLINILTHSNKNKYALTQIYNFLCDYGYEDYIKFSGAYYFHNEPAIYLNILLKVLYEIDSNVFNICGLKLKNKKRTFIYNVESYYKNKFNEKYYDELKKYDFTYYGGKEKNSKTKSIKTKYINPKELFNNNYIPIFYDTYDETETLTISDIKNNPEFILINYKTLINNITLKYNTSFNLDDEHQKIIDKIKIFYEDPDNKDNYNRSKFYKFLNVNNKKYKIHSYISLSNNYIHNEYNIYAIPYREQLPEIILIGVYVRLDDNLNIQYEDPTSFTKYFRNEITELNIEDKYDILNVLIQNKKIKKEFFNNKNTNKYIKYIKTVYDNIIKYKDYNIDDLLKIQPDENIDNDINDELQKIIEVNNIINYNSFKLMFDYLLNHPEYINKLYHLYYLGSNVNYKYLEKNKVLLKGGKIDNIKNDMYKYVYYELKKKGLI